MKTIISIVLTIVALLILMTLVGSILDPIEFSSAKKNREEAVVSQMKKIRTCQEFYRSITGEFAPTFDTMKQVLTSESLFAVQLKQDPEFPDDPDKFVRDTTFYNTMDSLAGMGIDLEGLEYVPFAENDLQFNLQADTVTYQQALVHVTECSVLYSDFMGPYADKKYVKYDQSYNPDRLLKFGSMTEPSLSGNWE